MCRLPCGHIYCDRCLYNHWNRQYGAYKEAHPDYKVNPQHPWTHPDIIKRMPAKIGDLLLQYNKNYRGPVLDCPTCRNRCSMPPQHSYDIAGWVEDFCEHKRLLDPSYGNDVVRVKAERFNTFFGAPRTISS